MARPTPHSALESAGFSYDPAGRTINQTPGRAGNLMTYHYVAPGQNGLIHHAYVSEYARNPGKYDVHYRVTSYDGTPHNEGMYDDKFRHEDNVPGGSKDPIRDVMQHHNAVANAISEEPKPRFGPGLYSLNSFSDGPDPYAHAVLTGGDYPEFEYLGNDDGTHLYHVAYQDPEDQEGMAYGFTVRYRPSAEPEDDDLAGQDVGGGVPVSPLKKQRARQFSYSVTHFPTDMGTDEHGEYPVGEFKDVVGTGRPEEGGYPVATFTNADALMDRHHSMMRSLGLMPKLPEPENENRGHFAPKMATYYLRRCPQCGNEDVDFMRLYDLDENGLHTIPGGVRGQCNKCYTEFEPKEALSPDAAEWSPSLERGASTARLIMQRADEDLRQRRN